MTVWKFCMVMQNHFSCFPCVLQLSLFCFILHDCAKISHGHVKLKNMIFRLFFAISPISSFLIHLHHLQLSSKVWSKCISSSSSSTLCTILHSIFHLSLHASKITLKYLQNSTKKTISISCKGRNVLLGHIRHNYYSKGMKLMKIYI